jgi:hypothetical protein
MFRKRNKWGRYPATVTPSRCLIFGLFSALAGCGDNSDDKSSLKCNINTLSGTWRVDYEERNGTCGPVPSETLTLTVSGLDEGTSPCEDHSRSVSNDLCRQDYDYTCPTTDKQGTQRWTGIIRQTAKDRLEGEATAQLSHPTGNCRSTYTVTWTKL